MIEFFLMFMTLQNVCAPFDHSYCGFDVVYMKMGDTKGYYDLGYTIYLNPWHPTFYERDCWGLTTWQHEWLHVQIGYWHLAGTVKYGTDPQCLFRDGYTSTHLAVNWLNNSGIR